MLRVTDDIRIPDAEIEERFVRSSGPGGQNVNKLATAVELRFDARRSTAFDDAVRARLERLAGQRLTRDGVIVIRAERFRTQERNRADARDRLVRLIRRAAEPPRPRLATRPGPAARERRLAEKSRRARTKRLRREPPPEE